jgi:hypothetical protein
METAARQSPTVIGDCSIGKKDIRFIRQMRRSRQLDVRADHEGRSRETTRSGPTFEARGYFEHDLIGGEGTRKEGGREQLHAPAGPIRYDHSGTGLWLMSILQNDATVYAM